MIMILLDHYTSIEPFNAKEHTRTTLHAELDAVRLVIQQSMQEPILRPIFKSIY